MRKEIKNIFHYAEVEKTGNGYIYHLDNTSIPNVQDCYGMSNQDQITDYWAAIGRAEREILVNIICRTQSPDTFISFLKITVLKRLTEKIYDETAAFWEKRALDINHREDELDRKIEIFQKCKKSIFKRFRKFNRIIANLQFKITSYENQHSAILGDQSRLMSENKRYYKIKHLLQAINAETV